MVKSSVPQRSGHPISRLRAGAMIGGIATWLAGCAQEPLPPAGAPDNCILLCALIRSVFDQPETTPPPIPKPTKPVHATPKVVTSGRPTVRRKTRRLPPPPVAATLPVEGMTPDTEAPVDSTAVPRNAEVQPSSQVEPVLGYTQLPGSVPIEENTAHFTPLAAEQR